jgi:hypothetical protein
MEIMEEVEEEEKSEEAEEKEAIPGGCRICWCGVTPKIFNFRM